MISPNCTTVAEITEHIHHTKMVPDSQNRQFDVKHIKLNSFFKFCNQVILMTGCDLVNAFKTKAILNNVNFALKSVMSDLRAHLGSKCYPL